MTEFAALLRAVNVGGTGKLAMRDLVALCEEAGFEGATTYIQSGNVVFRSALSEGRVKEKLEKTLATVLKPPVCVLVRTRAELNAILERNPFKQRPPSRVVVYFLDAPPSAQDVAAIVIPAREEVVVRGREAFVHYPEGMGPSKLKLPWAKVGTARNLNTITKLVAMTRAQSVARIPKASAPRLR